MSTAVYLTKGLGSKDTAWGKVINTVIYGVKSSGNEAGRSLRETARLSTEEYPQVNQIVQNDVYVDDCLSGEENIEKALQRADDLELVLNRGGFTLKGIIFTEGDPPSALSTYDSSIIVVGMKWFPKEDLLAFDIGELNFSEKQRRTNPVQHQNIIPSKLARQNCVSKVSEIFDLNGKITQINATMKMDLHTLVKRGLS